MVAVTNGMGIIIKDFIQIMHTNRILYNYYNLTR